jgi:hypothetical protein
MFKKLLKLIKPAPKISFLDRIANFEEMLLNNNLDPQKSILGHGDGYYCDSVSYIYTGNCDAEIVINKNHCKLLCTLDCGVIYYNDFPFGEEDIMLEIVKSSKYIP